MPEPNEQRAEVDVADKPLPGGNNPPTNTNCSKNRKRPRPRTDASLSRSMIYLVVVESHQHVLEHIHTVLRKEKLLTRDWSMLHFDAHPDLACPHESIPAKACFLPHQTFPSTKKKNDNNDNGEEEEKNLYELLDSTATGIAEWILPLVLAANLRNIHWIKPKMEERNSSDNNDNDEVTLPCPPSQLPLGVHRYQVGASASLAISANENGNNSSKVESFLDLPNSSTVKVDWPHPYYLEDGCATNFGSENDNENELLLFPQPLILEISELTPNNENNYRNPSDEAANRQPCKPMIAPPKKCDLWALDICLDYFVCQNPFLTDLEAVNPIFTRALLNAVYESRFYTDIMNVTTGESLDKGKNVILQHYQRDIRSYWSLLVNFLKQGLSSPQEENKKASSELLRYYRDPYKGRTLLEQLANALLDTSSPAWTESHSKLITMTEQALPNLVMPHQSTAGKRPAFSMETIQPGLDKVCDQIASASGSKQMSAGIPFIITMARSSEDGFTPSSIADELQNKLILFLHSLYCGCQVSPLKHFTSQKAEADSNNETGQRGGCANFQIIFDYGPWEGSVFS